MHKPQIQDHERHVDPVDPKYQYPGANELQQAAKQLKDTQTCMERLKGGKKVSQRRLQDLQSNLQNMKLALGKYQANRKDISINSNKVNTIKHRVRYDE